MGQTKKNLHSIKNHRLMTTELSSGISNQNEKERVLDFIIEIKNNFDSDESLISFEILQKF